MDNDEIRDIEAQMLLELKQRVAASRDALDLINPSIWTEVSRILGYGPISTDGWFISPSSILSGQCPIDVLQIDQNQVIQAALHQAHSKWQG